MRTNRTIDNIKSWLTDQSYTGGHGEDKQGTGPHTNMDHCNQHMQWDQYGQMLSDAVRLDNQLGR